ncbi:hypothetical protein L873DRAFT_1075976 [Choiromyces venosus 120613-1]|uniref:Uncharacterized protein n=1 Tax=Choiromyces venosus 120613-1 TaxID=1336337 RepID=A0A3N4JI72_9PEZI|nr:hypothetical protein L873DRAFT_1075976 [Choiromyces venosus 120613-1]
MPSVSSPSSSRTVDHRIPTCNYVGIGVILDLNCSLRISLGESVLLDEAVVIRGAGLCLKIRLRWDETRVDEAVIETFGRWFANAEMWEQLLFKTSLQVFGNSEWDIVLDLSRLATPTSQGDTEQLISTVLPTATLVCVSMEFGFSGLVKGLPLVSISSIMPIADAAIRGVWSSEIANIAPLCAYPGYLREVGEKASYIDLMSEEIEKITRRMGNETMGYRNQLWKVLMKGLAEKERERLKSLTGDDPNEGLELNESPMLLDEPQAEAEEDLLIFDEERDDAYFFDSFGDGSRGSRRSSEILRFMDDGEQEELLLQADDDSNAWI